MIQQKNIIAINGSASQNSSNLSVLKYLEKVSSSEHNFTIIGDLSQYPHFQTSRSEKNVPLEIVELRNRISEADGIIISTPEYVFSIPSRLKNLLEWLVSTTVLSEKPTAIITASAQGEKAHEEIQLIMRTLQAKFDRETTLLIKGIKGKIDVNKAITDKQTQDQIDLLVQNFQTLINQQNNKNTLSN